MDQRNLSPRVPQPMKAVQAPPGFPTPGNQMRLFGMKIFAINSNQYLAGI